MLTSKCVEPDKSTLVLWVDRAMRAPLTKANIQLGFRATRIWPLDATAVDHCCQPTAQFDFGEDEDITKELQHEKESLQTVEATSDATMVEGERDFYNGTADSRLPNAVPSETCKETLLTVVLELHNFVFMELRMQRRPTSLQRIDPHFQAYSLPRISTRSRKGKEPIIDYSHSYVITASQYTTLLHEKVELKEAAKKIDAKRKNEREHRAAAKS